MRTRPSVSAAACIACRITLAPAARGRLYKELSAREYTVVGILCSNEPIMTKWKWMLAARLPAKLFVINEFADFFSLTTATGRTSLEFLRVRLGLSGSADRTRSGASAVIPVFTGLSAAFRGCSAY